MGAMMEWMGFSLIIRGGTEERAEDKRTWRFWDGILTLTETDTGKKAVAALTERFVAVISIMQQQQQ